MKGTDAMSDDFGEISYVGGRDGSGYVDMSRLRNFASDDFDDDFDDDEAGEDTSSDADGEANPLRLVLVMLGLLLALAAIGGAVWYFALGGDAVVAAYMAEGSEAEPAETPVDDIGDKVASDVPESGRDKKPLSEADMITVAAFLSELKSRGFDVDGLDVDIPVTAEGEVYTGTEGILGAGVGDAGPKDGSAAGANAVTDVAATDGEVASAAVSDDATATDVVDNAEGATAEGGEAQPGPAGDGATSAEVSSGTVGTSASGTRFPIMRARLKRSDGAEFDVEWMDGSIKLRLISDEQARLPKAVFVVEDDTVVGYDGLKLSIWRERLDETSELVCRTREITADTMEMVDFEVARAAIAGTGNVAELLGRKVDAGSDEKGAGDGAQTPTEGASTSEPSAPTDASGTDTSSQ